MRRLMAGTLGGASAAKRQGMKVEKEPKKGWWKRKPVAAAMGSKVRLVRQTLHCRTYQNYTQDAAIQLNR